MDVRGYLDKAGEHLERAEQACKDRASMDLREGELRRKEKEHLRYAEVYALLALAAGLAMPQFFIDLD